MAKRSRRERRQLTEKQQKSTSSPIQTSPEPIVSVAEPVAPRATSSSRNGVDFAQEYYYVYTDLRMIVIVGALMIVVLIGLSFVI